MLLLLHELFFSSAKAGLGISGRGLRLINGRLRRRQTLRQVGGLASRAALRIRRGRQLLVQRLKVLRQRRVLSL